MKKGLAWLCILLLCLGMLTACKQETEYSFAGVVTKVGEGSMIVAPDAAEEIYSSGEEVEVSMESDAVWQVGDAVRVYYSGDILESYPLQVQVIRVEALHE